MSSSYIQKCIDLIEAYNLRKAKLTEWELDFLNDIVSNWYDDEKICRRQKETIDEIGAKNGF